MQLGFIATDQYGETIHLPDCKYPRKALLAKLGRQHAAKMFVDTKDGKAKHIGYVVGSLWFTLYEVHEWQGKAA